MPALQRRVDTEVLDGLAAEDPRARRSRRDLQRVHRAMRTLTALNHAVDGLGLPRQPQRVLELGAGDGSLLLRFARARRPGWQGVDLTLLDRSDVVAPDTVEAYRSLGWQVTTLQADALEWAARPPRPGYDLCFANLFLHHFVADDLRRLLTGVASATRAFVACEPRRSAVARVGSRLIGCLGTNAVTREDAVKSVAAGFTARELTAVWPATPGWRTREYAALPFTHCFTAVRSESAPFSA